MNQYDIIGIVICAMIWLFHIPYFINPAKKLSDYLMVSSLYASSFIMFGAIILYKDLMTNYDGLGLLPFYMIASYSALTFVHIMMSLIASRYELNNNNSINMNNLLGDNYNDLDDEVNNTKYCKSLRKCLGKMSPFHLSLVVIALFTGYTCLITYNISCHIDKYGDEVGMCFSWARITSFIASIVVLLQYIVAIRQTYFDKINLSLYNYHNMQLLTSTMMSIWLLGNDSVERSTWMPFTVMVIMNIVLMFVRGVKINQEMKNNNDTNDFQL